MAKRILGEVKDEYGHYTARAVVEERSLMPGYQFYVEVQKTGDSSVRKVKVGKMSAGFLGLVNYPPVFSGVNRITEMEFEQKGLAIRFLNGVWGAGLDGLLTRQEKFVPKTAFA